MHVCINLSRHIVFIKGGVGSLKDMKNNGQFCCFEILRIKNEQVVAEVVPRSSSVNVRFSFVLNQYQKLEQHMKSLVK